MAQRDPKHKGKDKPTVQSSPAGGTQGQDGAPATPAGAQDQRGMGPGQVPTPEEVRRASDEAGAMQQPKQTGEPDRLHPEPKRGTKRGS